MTKKNTPPAAKTTAAQKKAAAAGTMASRLSLSGMVAASTATEAKYPATINVADIVVKQQIRRGFSPATITEMAQSLLAQGQIQRIVVRKLPAGKYELIAGERRYRGAIEARMATLDADVFAVDDRQAKLMQLSENIQREDLGMIDKAGAIADLRDSLVEGRAATLEEIASTVKKTVAWVSESLQLLELPAVSKQAVESGLITDQTTANRMARIERLAGPEQARQLLDQLESGGKSRELVTDALRNVKTISKSNKVAKPAKVRKGGSQPEPLPEKSTDVQALAEALFGSVRVFGSLDSIKDLSPADAKALTAWLKQYHARGQKSSAKGVDVSYVVEGMTSDEDGDFSGKSGVVALVAYLDGVNGQAFTLESIYSKLKTRK